MEGRKEGHHAEVSPVCVITFLFAIVGSAGHIAADTPTGCFPNNLFSYTPGPHFSAKSNGAAKIATTEIHLAGSPEYESTTGGQLSWQLTESMSDNSGTFGTPQTGTIGGTLKASISWRNGRSTRFDSKCMAEVQTVYVFDSEDNSWVKEIELEAQGTVRGFPDDPTTGPQLAVASIVVKKEVDPASSGSDTGHDVQVQFSVELGGTCRENSSEFSTAGAAAAGRVLSQADNAGAFALPNGFNVNNCNPGGEVDVDNN